MFCVGTVPKGIATQIHFDFCLKIYLSTQASGGTALVILNCCIFLFLHKIIVQIITKIKMKPERKRHTHDI